jgi:predicted transcriptional regulator
MSTTLSVRIDVDTKKRLEALAKRARRSKSFLAAEAIANRPILVELPARELVMRGHHA